MTIRFDDITTDGNGLPVVSWVESRNIHGGGRPERIACYIRMDIKTRELMFCAAGNVRHGEFVDCRPWSALYVFQIDNADRYYWSAHERVAMELAGSKSKLARFALTDGAHVILANFRDERSGIPMHINCASARPVEIAALHDRLRREFIDKREDYLRELNNGEYIWGKRKRFKAFALQEPEKLSPRMDMLANVCVAVIIGLGALGVYWLIR